MPREVTHLLIGSVYHPPKANNFEMSEYLNSTMDIITRSHPNAGILLLGDFNQLPECHQKFSPLHQLVTRATRGSSVLDKVFTNVPTWYQIPVLHPTVTRSDHDTVLLVPNDDPPRPPKNPKVTYRRLLTPNRKALLFHHLSHFNWTPLFPTPRRRTAAAGLFCNAAAADKNASALRRRRRRFRGRRAAVKVSSSSVVCR